MKTAIQGLIFKLAYKERREYQEVQENILGGMNECIMLDAIDIQNKRIEELTVLYSEFIELEKKQIIEARITAPILPRADKSEYANEAEEYYNKNYNQNK